MDIELQNKIVRGEIDCNNQALFFKALYKGLIYELGRSIQVRGKDIPTIILNTGDDLMYLEKKGQDQSVSPLEQTNEDYIYNVVPRGIVTLDGIEVLSDQLTSPYVRGNFELEHEGMLYGFNAEFRRIPIRTNVTVKYYFDSFTDALEATQQVISKMLFVRNYNITYMGQTILCTYKVPTSINTEKTITFDGGTTDSKNRTIEMEFEIETNMPVYEPKTAILNSNYIKILESNLEANKQNTKRIVKS